MPERRGNIEAAEKPQGGGGHYSGRYGRGTLLQLEGGGKG
jgi:hypothetical protein